MWAQLLNVGLGIWLIIAPAVLDYGPVASNNGHVTGPLVATFAIISCWEFMRGVRRWNYLPGIWLLAAPWLLGYEHQPAMWYDSVSGILILIFASVKGNIRHRYGGGWSALLQRP